jgi:hypothetical protein
VANDGADMPAESSPDNPLTRYQIKFESPEIEPGRLPVVLPSLDTLWLEPIMPTYYCVALADSVPEFVAAPPIDPRPLSQLEIFYSIAGRDITRRQTGILDVHIDPALLHRTASPQPPIFPTEFKKPAQPLPVFEALRIVGHRRANCGDPEQPMEIISHEWDTPDGGRFFVLDYGGKPRKYLFDLNRDSIIEMEMWDSDGDGRFDARRTARFPIPPFLLPLSTFKPLDARVFASLKPDSLARLSVFARADAPYQIKTNFPDSVVVTDAFHKTVAFDPPRERILPEWGPQFHYTPLEPPPYTPLPEWGPQFHYTPLPVTAATAPAPPQPQPAQPQPAATTPAQPQPAPQTASVAVPEKPYVPLPPWGPQFHFTPLPAAETGTPAEQAERRAAREAARVESARRRAARLPPPAAPESPNGPKLLGKPVDSSSVAPRRDST